MKKGILLLLFILSGMFFSDCCNTVLTSKISISSYALVTDFSSNETKSDNCHCEVSCFRDSYFSSNSKPVLVSSSFFINYAEIVVFVKLIFKELLLPPPNIN